jgi:AraC-like DNA-binding protein
VAHRIATGPRIDRPPSRRCRTLSAVKPATDAIRVSPFVLTWPRLLGLPLSEVARAASIPLAKLEAAEELTYEETLSIWAALESLTGDPVVGLHAGSRFTIDQMGVVGPSLAHATHLDAALDALVRIMNVFVKNAGIQRVESPLGAGIAYRMPTLRSPHGVDTIFAATMALVRHCTGAPLVALAVDHQMPRRAETEYARFFGVTPRWKQATSALWFRTADLALPFRGASPELAELLAVHAPRLLSTKAQGTSFDQQLETAFWGASATGGATLESTAEALGTSARTLQRRLGAMKTTFAEKRGAMLHRRAMQLLLEETTPIETIAKRVGYSSRAAFERAFFRWEGKTPHAVRAGLR